MPLEPWRHCSTATKSRVNSGPEAPRRTRSKPLNIPVTCSPNRLMKFLGRPFWLMAVFVFTTKKPPVPDGLSASLKADSTAALQTVAATSPRRDLPDKRSSIQAQHPYSRLPRTPIRRHAGTASFVVAASPRCDLCGPLCNLLARGSENYVTVLCCQKYRCHSQILSCAPGAD